MISEKLEKMKQEYQEKLAQTEKSLTNKVETFMDSKIEAISTKVANQVAHTFMEAFMNRITQGNMLETNNTMGGKNIPLLTQEGYTTPSKEGTPGNTSDIKSNTIKSMQTSNEKTQTTKETNKPNITPNRSPHDISFELDIMKE